jgi:hypothetical protein
MTIEIPGARYLCFKRIFEKGEGPTPIFLNVPDYQRSYDWREEHRKDLFNDLERLEELCDHTTHFCGTVICTPNEKEPNRFEVVDGQQRLTTLVLMDALLSQATGEDPCVVYDGNLLFLPQESDVNFFKALVKNRHPGKVGTLGQRNMRDAANEIKAWVAGLSCGPKRMAQLVQDRLYVIFFILENADEVSKVFETINNRGKPLTQMDLVKNHLIYMKAVHRWSDVNVNSVWQTIQGLVEDTRMRGDESVDTVLRAVVNAMFHPRRRKAGETDYKVISDHIAEKCHKETCEQFLSFLESAFRTFRDLRAAVRTEKHDAVATQLTYLNAHSNIAGVLPLIFARQWMRDQDEKDAPVLEAIEKANFRLYGLPGAASRSDSRNVTLSRLAYAYLVRGKNNKEKLEIKVGGTIEQYSSVTSALAGIVQAQHKEGLDQIVTSLTLNDNDDYDFYGWEELRYFLARWEEYLLKTQSFDFGRLKHRLGKSNTDDYLAREHIIPQSTKGPVEEYNNKQQLRRLGNFMLLPQGVNAAAGKKTLTEKLDVFEERKQSTILLLQNTRLKEAVSLANNFCNHLEARGDEKFGRTGNRFNISTIKENRELVVAKTLCDLREEEMIAFALRTWRMEGERSGNLAFRGMFSFSHDGRCYVSKEEAKETKAIQNYILDTDDKAPATVRRKRRDKVLKRAMETVWWD